MTDVLIIKLLREALMTTMIISAPLLGVGMLVGLVISIFQTTTSIQEQTLTFVPKIVAVLASVMFFGPWMMRVMSDYTIRIFRMLIVTVYFIETDGSPVYRKAAESGE